MHGKPESLTLTVELKGEEVQTFLELADTDNVDLQLQIAKSLVLGAKEVTDPDQVRWLVNFLVEIRAFGLGDRRATQDMADEMMYTIAELNREPVKSTVSLWARYNMQEVEELVEACAHSDREVHEWFKLNVKARSLLDMLLQQLKRRKTMADA